MASETLIKSLKYWYSRGLKDATYINSLVTTGVITQAEANTIMGGE